MKRDVALNSVRSKRVPKNLVHDLRKLGFTEYEARTYLALLEDYPATAYEVAKTAGLPRANVYGALDVLEKKAAVQPVTENPVRYVPVAPNITLDIIARNTSALCSDIAKRLDSIGPEKRQDYVWVLEDEDSIHRRIGEIIATARKHIWIKAHEDSLARHIDTLRAATARDVRLVVILFGGPGADKRLALGDLAQVYLHEGTGVVVGMGQSLITVTADFKVALTADCAKKAWGAFTHSRPVVNLAESLIRHEIYLAEIFEAYGTSITKRFGPFLQDLRRKYLPKDQVVALDKVIKQERSSAGKSRRGEKPSAGNRDRAGQA
jgi:predicted transcriptional regulator